MGIYFCKRPETYPEPAISYDLLCSSLTKWFGEPATFAHVIYLDNLSTSYISEVIRWKVCASRPKGYEYVELVLKTYPRNKSRGLSFRSDVFFKNEIAFYENILPALLKFHSSRATKPFNNHLRLFLSVCDGKQDSLVFANEHIQGFESPKKKLDLKHAKLVLVTLAKFHAISFAMKEQSCEEFERICNGITETYYDGSNWSCYKRLWSKIWSVAKDAVEKEYPNTKYIELINKFAVQSRFKDLVKAVNDKNNCVIQHGDCSVSNYMFKYEGEMPVDVKMMDFQQTRCASPVLDVVSVLYTNTDLLQYEEELLKNYHETLAIEIENLGSNPNMYNWDTFINEVCKYSYFGLAVSFENTTTTLTAEDITNRQVALGWLTETKIRNIADIHEVENLENKQMLDLAKNFVHCVDKGYITESLLQSYMFFW
ncbi:uncharacterized protein isoform X1 [Choristoneura fumiferana]|uniref:uncharacterized protein isoform X1 n=1 Tax=Choristoneura fumiferana TaxID=7141 RepID=UPI003D15B2DA